MGLTARSGIEVLAAYCELLAEYDQTMARNSSPDGLYATQHRIYIEIATTGDNPTGVSAGRLGRDRDNLAFLASVCNLIAARRRSPTYGRL